MVRKNQLNSTPVRRPKARWQPSPQSKLPKIPTDIEGILDFRSSQCFKKLIRKGCPRNQLVTVLKAILRLGNDKVQLHPRLDDRYPSKSFAPRLENIATEIEKFNEFPLLAPARTQIATKAEWNRSAFSGGPPIWARIFADVHRPGELDELPARLRSYAQWVRFADQQRKRMYPKKGFRLKHQAILSLLIMVKFWTGEDCFPEVADLLDFLHLKVNLSGIYTAAKLRKMWDRLKRNVTSAVLVSVPRS